MQAGEAHLFPGAPRDEPPMGALQETAETAVLDPALVNHLFYPHLSGFPARPTPDAIVARALAWPSDVRAMEITKVDDQVASVHRVAFAAGGGVEATCLFPPGPPMEVGMRIAVGLVGAVLKDGRVVPRRRGAQFTLTGEALAVVSDPPGADLTAAFGAHRGQPRLGLPRGRELAFWGASQGLLPVQARRIHRWLLAHDPGLLPARLPTEPLVAHLAASLPALADRLVRPLEIGAHHVLACVAEPVDPDDELLDELVAFAGDVGFTAWDAGGQHLWEPGALFPVGG